MININSIYNPDCQQSLEYHRDLLKIAENARLVHEAWQTHPNKPSASRRWDWVQRLLPALRQRRTQPALKAHVRP